MSKEDAPLVARVFPELFLDEDDNLIKPSSVPVGLSSVLKYRYIGDTDLCKTLRRIMREHEHMKQKLNGEVREDSKLVWVQ